jgi:hypothetical protein
MTTQHDTRAFVLDVFPLTPSWICAALDISFCFYVIALLGLGYGARRWDRFFGFSFLVNLFWCDLAF